MKPFEFLLKLRFIMPLTALALLLYSTNLVAGGGYEKFIVYDYSLWLSTFLVCFSVYLDIKLPGEKFSYASTLLLGVLGATEIIIGRAASLILNQAMCSPYKLIPLFGSAYSPTSFIVSLIFSVCGTILASIALLIHSILKRPIKISDAPPMTYAIKATLSLLARFWERVCNHRWLYLFLAFLFGFTFRFIPELIWWPWLIGWDTVEYVAHLMDFMEKLNPFTSYHWMGSMRNCPPLLNILLCLPALAIGAWNTFKLYPSVAYGLLALSSALFAKRVLKLNNLGSFFVSITTALFVINLRISWDYQRQLLGSVFMLLSITALDSYGRLSAKAAAISSVLLLCCALSHEVTAFSSAVLSIVLMFRSIKYRDLCGAAAASVGLVSSVALEVWYWGRPYTPNVYFTIAPVGVVSYPPSEMSEAISYLVAGFGLTIPFALLTLLDKSHNIVFSKVGLFSLMAAGLSPLLAPYTSVATWYRFLAGAAPLVSTLAGSWIVRSIGDKRFHFIFMLLLLILAFPYAYGVGNTYRFVSALREFPQGLVPSPADSGTLSDLKSLSEWFKGKELDSVIIARPGEARWIHLAIRNPTPNDLLWMWQAPISTGIIKQVLKDLGVDTAYVVCDFDLEGTEGLEIYKLREGIFRVYVVKCHQCSI